MKPIVRYDKQSQNWDVVDRETGERLGCVFKYIGSWWVNSAGNQSNRRGSKAAAVAECVARAEGRAS